METLKLMPRKGRDKSSRKCASEARQRVGPSDSSNQPSWRRRQTVETIMMGRRAAGERHQSDDKVARTDCAAANSHGR
jgi:hypothetical protein